MRSRPDATLSPRGVNELKARIGVLQLLALDLDQGSRRKKAQRDPKQVGCSKDHQSPEGVVR